MSQRLCSINIQWRSMDHCEGIVARFYARNVYYSLGQKEYDVALDREKWPG